MSEHDTKSPKKPWGREIVVSADAQSAHMRGEGGLVDGRPFWRRSLPENILFQQLIVKLISAGEKAISCLRFL